MDDKELDKLFSLSEKDYGDGYKDKLFEQYRIFLEMLDSLSDKRSVANNFFLTFNTGLLSVLGLLFNLKLDMLETSTWWIIATSIAGILLAYAWFRTVKSYKQLSKVKWKLVLEIEKHLPLLLHETEWKMLGEGIDKTKYRQLTGVEQYLPLIFVAIYSIFIILGLATNNPFW